MLQHGGENRTQDDALNQLFICGSCIESQNLRKNESIRKMFAIYSSKMGQNGTNIIYNIHTSRKCTHEPTKQQSRWVIKTLRKARTAVGVLQVFLRTNGCLFVASGIRRNFQSQCPRSITVVNDQFINHNKTRTPIKISLLPHVVSHSSSMPLKPIKPSHHAREEVYCSSGNNGQHEHEEANHEDQATHG